MRLSSIRVQYKWLLGCQTVKAWELLRGADEGKRLSLVFKHAVIYNRTWSAAVFVLGLRLAARVQQIMK